jgi:acyl-CoA synthetase (AMP-forming)/AMP-acid ligase II
MWLTQLLDRNRRCYGETIALVDERRSLTWRELDEQVRAIAGALLRLGLRPGDRVVIASRDRTEAVEAYFALARIGAAFVPVNPGLPALEADRIVRQVKAAAVIGESAAPGDRLAFDVPVVLDLDGPWFAAPGPPACDGLLPDVRPDDIAAIMHTSATTGSAKGIVWDHRSLMHVCLSWLAVAEPDDDMTFINCSPLYHGSLAMSFTYLAAGARQVLLPYPGPAEVLRAIERHRATHVWLVPDMLHQLTRAAVTERHDTASLREIVYGGAPTPWPVYAGAAGVFGCGFRQAYGVTEAGGHLAMLGPREHPPAAGQAPRGGLISAGRPLPGVSVRIKTPAGAESAGGEIGEVCVRSDSLMRGYWDDPRSTADVTRDGWLSTGDLGRIDDDGFLWLSGRCVDLIRTDGHDIRPADIERVLRTHNGVADSAVVGRPDPAYGEVPIAYVVPAGVPQLPTTGELVRLVAAELASHQVPASITFLDDLPRNAVGKVLRHVLRDMALSHPAL